MSRVLDGPVDTAALWVTLAACGAGGSARMRWHELRTLEPEGGRSGSWWDCARPQAVAGFLAREAARDGDVTISPVPRRVRGMDGADSHSCCLWARVEGARAGALLANFRPEPSLVLRDGSAKRWTALWLLSKPLPVSWAKQGNRRIAYRLRVSAGAMCDPEQFFLRPPGTEVREGKRSRFQTVRAVHVDPREYTPRQVVGRLKEAPDPNAWAERAGYGFRAAR